MVFLELSRGSVGIAAVDALEQVAGAKVTWTATSPATDLAFVASLAFAGQLAYIEIPIVGKIPLFMPDLSKGFLP